jgi:hypothetical protein
LEPFVASAAAPERVAWRAWRDAWWAWSRPTASGSTAAAIAPTLERWNLPETPVRSVIERIWAAIDQHDDWGPLEQWLARTSAASADAASASAASE